MPIPGLTDRFRLPRIDKIRLGKKTKNQRGTEYPSATDYFVLPDAVREVYGDKPKTIYPVQFPTNNIDDFFPTARKAHRKTSLFCASYDGEIAIRQHVGLAEKGPHKGKPLDPTGHAHLDHSGQLVGKDAVEVGQLFEMPCAGEDCNFWRRDLCKFNGRLLFVLPKVTQGGCFEIATTSWHSIGDVMNTLRFVEARAKAVGLEGVAWLPFHLDLVPKRVAPDGKAKTIHVLRLRFEGEFPQQVARPNMRLEAPNETPDDLYPHGGQTLDDELDGTEAAQQKTLDAIYAIGKELGMNNAQMAAEIAKAEGNIDRLLDELQAELSKKEEADAQPPAEEPPAEEPPAEPEGDYPNDPNDPNDPDDIFAEPEEPEPPRRVVDPDSVVEGHKNAAGRQKRGSSRRERQKPAEPTLLDI